MPAQTYEQVLEILGRDCPPPDYPKDLAPESLPLLETVIAGANQIAAERALLAAAQVAPAAAFSLVEKAALSPKAETRIAAARAAVFLQRDGSTAVAQRLLGDADPGVVKYALRVVEQQQLSNLKPKVERLATESASDLVKSLALRTKDTLQ
jgi:hypothetical protein